MDEACETKPLVNVPNPVKVEAPVTERVEEKAPVPPLNVPIVALLEKRDVDVAVPKYPVPLAVNAVVDA